jgi:hypothetical protein
MKSELGTLGVLLSVTLLVSCGGQSQREPVEIFPGSPRALDEHVLWIDQRNDRALLLDVARTHPRPQVSDYAVPANPVSLTRRNEHNELLLLARGERSGDGVLSVLGPSRVEREYPLGSRFDRLIQSEEGRYAFTAFYPGGGADDDQSLLFNPNEVAVVDLDGEGEAAVHVRSLRGLGSAPVHAFFSPIMDLAGEERRVLVVLFDSHVAIMDLNHLDRPEYTVELSGGASVGLSTVRFSAEENKIYLLGARSDDVYVLTLLPAGANRSNDFEPSLNQLGAGARPTDMVLYQADDDVRLLAVTGSQALIIEAGSNRVTPIPLGAAASRILLFNGTAPADDVVEQRALLYGPGTPVVTFLDLEQVEERTTRNLEELPISGGVAELTELEENLILVTRVDDGLTMIDLEGRAASELSAQVDLSAAIPSLEMKRLWVRPEGTQALAFLDFALGRFTPGQVALDEPAQELMLFTNTDHKRVALTHDLPGGGVTILNAEDPGDKDAITLRGFFYTDLLERSF